MKEEILFTLDTPFRQPLQVKGWYFGNPEKKTLAVMGALRGNEIQQMYICARLIRALTELEEQGNLTPECGVLVIPCANQFSMNVGRRFWAADNTDINRMFPGYDQGETTQRVADRIFRALQGYRYGIHVTSFYLPGRCLPHVRIMRTGYERPEEAMDFGLPYILLRQPHPYDTTTLNYNWQIWDTQTFSLYTRQTEAVDEEAAEQAVTAVLRFLARKGFCRGDFGRGAETRTVEESSLHTVSSTEGGLFVPLGELGDRVEAGAVAARILDPCTAQVRQELRARTGGWIFFLHRACLINGRDVAIRILPD